MRKITEDNKGITLIVLIVTVLIMLILISVTTYTGINTYKETIVNHFVTQMQLIQAKVDDLVNTKTVEELSNLNLDSVTTQEQQNAINLAYNNGEVTTNEASSYKVFNIDNIADILDIDDVQNDILVNFNTREVISLEGIEYNGKKYFTQYKLPNGQVIINEDNSGKRNLAFGIDTPVDGLNCAVTINNISITNGTLSFAEIDLEGNTKNWQTITNNTEKNKIYTNNITKAGKYVFKLQDNTNKSNSIEKQVSIIIANKPKTSITLQTTYNYGGNSNIWAYMQKDGVNYVWIPRFVYKTNSETNDTEIKFIKGNSNIATDNTYINSNEGWILHNKFTTSNGTALTGVWISVNSINQEGLDMITLLNDSNTKVLTEI